MDKNYVVYKLTNIINNKVYIGLSKNVKVRWSYNGIHYKKSPKIFNAINKYGWDNFKKEIIKDDLTREEACLLEIETIELYKSRNRKFGYNIAKGGNGGVIYLKHPKGMLGKKQTEYQKKSHSKWALDKNNNCMTNGKVVWGKTHKHPKGMKGKKQTEHQKRVAKNNKHRCKKIKASFKNGEIIIFNSLNECCDYINLQPSSSVVSKLLKTNEPYKLSKGITKEVKEKLEKLVGLKLEYIKDNSEVCK